MLWKITCTPGFGPQWRANAAKPATLYAQADSADDAKYLAMLECARHVFEEFVCYACEPVEQAPADEEVLRLQTTYGEDEDHRIVVPATDRPDGTGKELPHVCLTKITSKIKKELAGGGQDITGL